MTYRVSTRLERIAWISFFALAPFGQTNLGMLLLAIWAITNPRDWYRRLRELGSPWKGFIGVTVIGGALSAAISPFPLVAAGGFLGLIILTTLVAPAGYWLVRENQSFLREELLPVFTVSGLLAMMIALVRWVFGGAPRIDGLLVGPNGFATVLIVLIGLAVGHMEEGNTIRRLRRGGRGVFTPVWVAWGYFILGASSLVATYSRGGWFGFAVMLVIYIGRHIRRSLFWLVTSAGIAAVYLCAAPGVGGRLLSSFSLEGNSDRLFIWSKSLELFWAYRWTGVGPAAYGFAIDSVFVPQAGETGIPHAHNFLLMVVAELGLVGGGAIVALLCLAMIFPVYRLWRRGTAAHRGAAGAYVGVMVHQLVDATVHGMGIGGLFWLLIGLIWAYDDYLRSIVRNAHSALAS